MEVQHLHEACDTDGEACDASAGGTGSQLCHARGAANVSQYRKMMDIDDMSMNVDDISICIIRPDALLQSWLSATISQHAFVRWLSVTEPLALESASMKCARKRRNSVVCVKTGTAGTGERHVSVHAASSGGTSDRRSSPSGCRSGRNMVSHDTWRIPMMT